MTVGPRKKRARLEGHMSYCRRCATGQLPGATVCRICCAPLDMTDSDPTDIAAPAIAMPATPSTVDPETVFASWPFGGADADAAAQVAAGAFAAKVRDELKQYAARPGTTDPGADNGTYSTAQNTTYSVAGKAPESRPAMPAMPAMPVQRAAQKPTTETHSVPSVGPNPFLAAVRTEEEDEELDAPEAYSA